MSTFLAFSFRKFLEMAFTYRNEKITSTNTNEEKPTMYDIITIGEILVEILTEHTGQVFYRPGTLLGPYPSGAPAIFIDQAARMGARSAIIAKVGRDDFARLNLERLAQDGVDTAHIRATADNSTGVAFVTYFADGSRQFIFHFAKAACGELAPEDVDETLVAGARYLHVMGCSITGSPTMGEAIVRAVRLAKARGVRVSFDPNIRPELMHGAAAAHMQEVLDAADVLLSGKSELALLLPHEAEPVAALLAQRARTVVVKDGARGACLYTRETALRAPVYPAREVDPTGAGDCFDATFLAGLCAGLPLAQALARASAAGAKAVEMRGPMEGNTTQAELTAFMDSCALPAPVSIENPYRC
jgi:sugar/nucleoside kinase (ribokinase family)